MTETTRQRVAVLVRQMRVQAAEAHLAHLLAEYRRRDADRHAVQFCRRCPAKWTGLRTVCHVCGGVNIHE